MHTKKTDLSERNISTRFITPALQHAGWNLYTQVREEVTFTRGRIIVRGKLVSRGTTKRADYILSYKPNLPLAVITPASKPICSSLLMNLGQRKPGGTTG